MNSPQTISSDPRFPHYIERSEWPWQPTPYIKPIIPKDSHLPKISVITPSYNQGKYIEETIRSVLLQDYPNLEYIIIDGGSTDETVGIIKKYEPWLAYWESTPDRGQSHALNKGIEKATGDWVAWLNTDDIYLQRTFSAIASVIVQSHESISWIVGTTIFTDQYLREISKFEPHLYTEPSRDIQYEPTGWIDFVCTKRSGIALPQPSSFWKRDAIVQAGMINEKLRYAMDHDLYGHLAYQGFRPLLLEQPLACFRTHHDQKTADFPVAFWREELNIVNDWIKHVDGADKYKLKMYGIWLNRYIKTYPYRSFFYNLWAHVIRMLKSTYNCTKNITRRKRPK